MKTTQSYKINEIKKLIDLNGPHKNFSLNFKATSADSSPFKAIVVDQVSLESNNIPEYKIASEGIITGNVKSDSGVYLNYFLMLKSDEPIVVDVEIDLTPLPNTDTVFNESPQNTLADTSSIVSAKKQNFLDKKYFGVSLRIILVVLVVAAIGGFAYFKYFKKSSSSEDSGLSTLKDETEAEGPGLSLEDALREEAVIKSSVVSPILESKPSIPVSSSADLHSQSNIDSNVQSTNVQTIPSVDIGTPYENHSVVAIASESVSTRNNSAKASEHTTPQKYTNSLLSRIQNLPDL